VQSFVSLDQLVASSQAEWPDESRPVIDRLKEMTPGETEVDRMTVPTLRAGEQFRFHFDMTRCIGCRCCEVACNEQNNNPPDVTWRRVGEIEGGVYPDTVRLHVSMACNHCLEPSCLEGCPVDAYTKLDNGVVAHEAETCIGCQYCTWNCPYGVPQFHAERRVVTKCNMCVDRLAEGQLPACVNACPADAIEIEAVDVVEWRDKIESADAPGVPPADLTLSTTRLTLPENLPESMGHGDAALLVPEAPHWSLVFFLTLSQWSIGLFGAVPFFVNGSVAWLALSAAAFVVGHASLLSAVFHLGRPIYAMRAVKAWRHSWLSREVIAFGLYAAAGVCPLVIAVAAHFGRNGGAAASVWTSPAVFLPVLGLTVLIGVVGVACSVGIYRIPARPAWDSRRTPIQFFATTALLGGVSGLFLSTLLAEGSIPLGAHWVLAAIVSLSAVVAAFAPWQLVLGGLHTDDAPIRSAAVLLTRRFGRLFWSRTVALCAVAACAPTTVLLESPVVAAWMGGVSLALALFAELGGRFLFFVTVVPRNMPGSFFSGGGGGHL
jgi:DMSO reductase iron-sulfur subunit